MVGLICIISQYLQSIKETLSLDIYEEGLDFRRKGNLPPAKGLNRLSYE